MTKSSSHHLYKRPFHSASPRLVAAAFFIAAFLFMFSAAVARSAEPAAGATKNESLKSTVLFYSWDNVYKGRLEPLVDVSKVSPEGRKSLEGLQQSWNRKFETNAEAGMKMYMAPHNIHIAVEKARKEPMTLKADQPWEAVMDSLTMTILQEGDLLRCWYGVILSKQSQTLSFQDERAVESGAGAWCYAESRDGITWTKPNLGVISYNGSKSNNIVSYMTVYGSMFHDPQGAPGEQYKSVAFDKLPPEELAKNKGGSYNSYCLYAMISPDGYHWTTLTNNPLVRHFCDTQNITAWDPLLKKYVGFFRYHQAGRAISHAETDDFHKWPVPQPLLESSSEDAPDVSFYNNSYTTYPGEPSLRLLFPSTYHEGTGHVDVRMAMSWEGHSYWWVSHEPIIDLGKPGEWDSGQIYCSPNLIRLNDGRLALPYTANTRVHNEGMFYSFYTNAPIAYPAGWAIWDDARLAGIETDTDGEFYTQPFRPEGERLEINARTASNGSVKAELCADGLPITGYTLAENVPLEGNHVWFSLHWKNKADISELKGKKLQLHVVLNHSKIFAYRITTAGAGERAGR